MLAALVLGPGPSVAAQSRDEFAYWDGNGNGDLTCSEAVGRDEGLRLPAYKDNRDGTGIIYEWLERQRSSDTDNDGIACDSSSNPRGYIPKADTMDPKPTGCPPDAETWRGLKVCAERSREGYDRDDYGSGYSSLEDDIIAALPATMKKSGQVYTPYSCIAFDIRADGTAATDIEHIVALAEAHDSGIADDRRRNIASDLDNLTIADPTVNRSAKSDRDAAEWMPDRHGVWFAARVIAVKREYELSVDPAERDALEALLAGTESELNCVGAASVPGTPMRLTATAGNGSITLNWNAPADGGSSILRYEYRYKAATGHRSYGEWTDVPGGPSQTSVTIPGLTNGVEYAFQVRAVSDVGDGEPATVNQTPGAVPDAPTLFARGGNGTVTLIWEAPANDGGAPILNYDVRYRESGATWGAWMEVEGGSSARSTTITGLINGTSYEFQVRAVNGKGAGAEATTESTPMPELNFAHFANGTSGGVTITSEIVLVNVETSKVYPTVFFYNQMGEQLDAGTVVDPSGRLTITEDGGVAPAMGLKSLGEITISTHGRGALVIGSAKVFSDGRVGGVLRFGIPSLGVAGVGASETVNDAIFPARRMERAINTGAAIRNLSSESLTVTCLLMQGGKVVDTAAGELVGDGHISLFIDEMFPGTDTTDFVGSVRCTGANGGMFAGVALELDAANGIFTTLPMVPLNNGESMLNFAHFANGEVGDTATSSDLVFVNVATFAVTPVVYFYGQDGGMIAADMVVDAMMDGVEVGEDGALMVMDEIPPLGEMTISTSGMGDLMVGSVRVVSDGPIGGVLRFDIPAIGVAGVGASEAVNAAIFPARRMADGINTGAAIRNLMAAMTTVTCRLMAGGQRMGEAAISLAGNGQNSQFINEIFPRANTDHFEGSVHCTAPAGSMFTGVALEMDFNNRIFTTLPVVPVR